MTRHTPDQEAVRDRLREAGSPESREPGSGNGTEAPAEAPADRKPGPAAAAAPADSEPAADSAADEGKPAQQQQQQEDPLATARRERDEYLELAKRTQADFENYRKRAAKDISAAGGRARIGLVRELLPVVDNLERALSSAGDADDGFVQGVRLVYSELQGVLARVGVEAIEPAGEQFDPMLHEALSTRAQDGAEAGVVLDVVEKGYRTADTVVRPARVIVAG